MKKSPYQLERLDLIERARELQLLDAKIYGDKDSLDQIFNANPTALDELRKQIVEQERWNREQRLWLIAVFAAVASVVQCSCSLGGCDLG